MRIKAERIKKDIEAFAQFTSTPGFGVTRLPFTLEDKAAKEYIKQQMLEAGLTVTEDGAGTVTGRAESDVCNAPVIMVGSHYDSVRNGGAFDGTAGLVAAIESARVLISEKVKLKYPVEIVAMNDEEGVRFGTGMFSSRAIVGDLTEDELDTVKDENQVTVRQAMQSIGIIPEIHKALRKKEELKAFLELHIEQGPLLEKNAKEIGIVNGIVGLAAYRVTIEGRAGHAGTTPMHLRADALLAASEIISFISSASVAINSDMVATVGEINVSPNASNVIPGKVEFTVDARSAEESDIDQFFDELSKKLEQLENNNGIRTQIKTTFYCKPVILSERVKTAIRKETEELGLSFQFINSGAGHDSMVLADFTDTGMIFVPSRNGISHTPEEWTDYEDLQKGAEVLLNTIINLGTID